MSKGQTIIVKLRLKPDDPIAQKRELMACTMRITAQGRAIWMRRLSLVVKDRPKRCPKWLWRRRCAQVLQNVEQKPIELSLDRGVEQEQGGY